MEAIATTSQAPSLPRESGVQSPPPPNPSLTRHDGASTISRANSTDVGGPFSGADAALMAHAFRETLRKPEFDELPPAENDEAAQADAAAREAELMSKELADEGRDIRSVSSERGVLIEPVASEGDHV